MHPCTHARVYTLSKARTRVDEEVEKGVFLLLTQSKVRPFAPRWSQMAPDGPNADRQTFLSYAYNMAAHALDMKSIAELLIQHDKASEQAALGTDQLREALAAHYGGTVEMCVACHNRFRKTVVE